MRQYWLTDRVRQHNFADLVPVYDKLEKHGIAYSGELFDSEASYPKGSVMLRPFDGALFVAGGTSAQARCRASRRCGSRSS